MAHILVVEDDFAIRELIKRNLKMVGHTCNCLAEGKGLEELMDRIVEGRSSVTCLLK